MQFDLFSQSLVIVMLSMIYGGLTYAVISSTLIRPYITIRHRKGHYVWQWRHVGIIVGIMFAVSIAIFAIVQSMFPQDAIPPEMIIWMMPLGAAIGIFGYTIRQLWPAIASACAIGCSVILGLLLVNNYYHYYPTLGALVGHAQDNAAAVSQPTYNAAQGKTVFEQYYQPLDHQSKTGRLMPITIPASKEFASQQARVYLPPALENNDLIRLPVVVLLPGSPGKPVDWEQAGLLSIMDTFAGKHKGLAPIVIVADINGMKDVDTECVDSVRGHVETYLIKDVPEYIRTHYRASDNPADWTIAGYSAGGTCSTMLALRHPTVYRNYMNITGDALPSLRTPEETLKVLFGGSLENRDDHTPNTLLARGNPLYASMNAWYFVGKQDAPAMVGRVIEQSHLASKAGLTVQQMSVSGHHSFLLWKQGYTDGLPWIMNRIRFTLGEK